MDDEQRICLFCGYAVPSAALECPNCGGVLPAEKPKEEKNPRKVKKAVKMTAPMDNAATVKILMDVARRLEEQGNPAAALENYRQALEMLPPKSDLFEELTLTVQGLEMAQSALPSARQETEEIPEEKPPAPLTSNGHAPVEMAVKAITSAQVQVAESHAKPAVTEPSPDHAQETALEPEPAAAEPITEAQESVVSEEGFRPQGKLLAGLKFYWQILIFRHPSGFFWLSWFSLTTIGLIVGGLAAREIWDRAGVIGSGLIFSYLLGTAQWLIIKTRLRDPGWWIHLTILGGAAGLWLGVANAATLVNVLGRILAASFSGFVSGVVVGLGIGFCQWLVWRNSANGRLGAAVAFVLNLLWGQLLILVGLVGGIFPSSVVFLIGCGLAGLTVGILQWRLVPKQWNHRWAIVLGALLGMGGAYGLWTAVWPTVYEEVVFRIHESYQLFVALVVGAVVGLCIGLCQWLLLKQVRKPVLGWLLVNTFMGGIGAMFVALAVLGLPYLFHSPLAEWRWILAAIGFGLPGVITGWPLSRWLARYGMRETVLEKKQFPEISIHLGEWKNVEWLAAKLGARLSVNAALASFRSVIQRQRELINQKLQKKELERATARIKKTARRRVWFGWIIGGLIILVGWAGVGLLILGNQDLGPLASLAPATPTPTASRTPMPTRTPMRTSTPIPTTSRTPMPTKTPARTPTPTLTITSTPTLEPGATQISEKDGMVMVYVPEGAFIMGSNDGSPDEQPVHKVFLDAFWIDQTEVTNALYALCVKAGACSPPVANTSSYYNNSQYANYPVIFISWYDAEAYCEWAGRCLPTEAEWEKAARGGLEGKLYPWGDQAPTCQAGATNGAQYGSCSGETVAVMTFSPNGYGLYDMAGNVGEWVADWYSATYYGSSPSSNPTGPASGRYRVLRGGSWDDSGNVLRSAYRYEDVPDYYYYYIGFRCVRSP